MKFDKGDVVECINIDGISSNSNIKMNEIYIVFRSVEYSSMVELVGVEGQFYNHRFRATENYSPYKKWETQYANR